jgi:flagellar hook protein FlgE
VLTFTGDRGNQTLGTYTFTVTATSTLDELMTFMQNSLGIDSAIPDDGIATTPTPGLSLETDTVDPNYAHVLFYGNSGLANKLSLKDSCLKKADGTTPMSFITGTSVDGYANNAAGESVKTTFTVYDSLGTEVSLDVTLVKESQDSNGTYWRFYVNSPDNIAPTGASEVVANGTLSFGTDGQLRDSTGTQISVYRFGTGAASPLVINLDMSEITAYTSSKSSMAMSYQDGSAVGYLSGFSIGSDGVISGTFSNGISRTLGQIAIATFTNPQGLVDTGGNMYVSGANSGDAIISTPGSMGVGNLVSGSLELSNVDLSKEFVSMIIASTGYSASSRVISTSDQMVQELLNTAR